MERVRQVLPGLGDPVPLRIAPGSAIAGQSLAEANLRGITGATVLAILRDGESVTMPSGSEVVRAGDVLAVVGSDDAVDAARAFVTGSNGTIESATHAPSAAPRDATAANTEA